MVGIVAGCPNEITCTISPFCVVERLKHEAWTIAIHSSSEQLKVCQVVQTLTMSADSQAWPILRVPSRNIQSSLQVFPESS